MRNKKKAGPVICSRCKRELFDYKEIAADIRNKAGLLAAVESGEAVLSIPRRNLPSSCEHVVRLALSANELMNAAMAPSRRRVLNIAKYPCPNPQCGGRFYEWERLH
jgi:hypothetical protein